VTVNLISHDRTSVTVTMW